MLPSLGAAISVGSSIASKLFGRKGKNRIQRLELPDFMTGLWEFNRQFPAINQAQDEFNKLASKSNVWYQGEIGKLASGLMPAIEQQSKNLLAWSRGEIPQDVINRLSEISTQLDIGRTGGIRGDGGLSKFYGTTGSVYLGNRLRDTSLALQMQAAQLTPQLLNVTQALTPYRYDAAQYMFTPQQIIDRLDRRAVQNWQVENLNRMRRRNIFDTIGEAGNLLGLALSGTRGLGTKTQPMLPVFSSSGGILGEAPKKYAPYGAGYSTLPGGGLAAIPRLV